MPRVICTLPNASELINGVAFAEDRGQMVSAECTDEQAALFASIPGYVLVDEEAQPASTEPAKPAKGKAAPALPAA